MAVPPLRSAASCIARTQRRRPARAPPAPASFERRVVPPSRIGAASTASSFFSTASVNGAAEQHATRSASTVREVTVTQSRSSDDASHARKNIHLHTNGESMELVDRLLLRTSNMLDADIANVVAYSGGVDSSLVAALVYRTFSNANEPRGSVQAVLGISPAVPRTQVVMARKVAEQIGIPLTEVATAEGDDEEYRKNDGHACFVCKTHLYSTLQNVADSVMQQQQQQLRGAGQNDETPSVILYNGTNADDTQDPTRLGLKAASNFQVHSPLDRITKDEVRQAAKYLGLPNWNAAASPCLRSRLAMGVMATEGHLRAVEMAEEFVRRVLELDETVNARVRMLSGGKAMVELDNSLLERYSGGNIDSDHQNWVVRALHESGFEEKCIEEWGFNSFGGVRGFKTGSVAAMPNDGVITRQRLASVD